MKMNAPSSPPAHRLPVLTEVVQLADAPEVLPAAVVDAHEHPRVDPRFTGDRLALQMRVEQPAPFPFPHDGPSPPEWLKRRPGEPRVELPLPAMAPQTPLPSDFSGSWWGRDEGPAVLPSSPSKARMRMAIPASLAFTAQLTPVPAASKPVSEHEVVRRVLTGLEGQLDAMFDHRIRDVLVPTLARAAETLMGDLRKELTLALHEMVARAVVVELARQGQGGDAN